MSLLDPVIGVIGRTDLGDIIHPQVSTDETVSIISDASNVNNVVYLPVSFDHTDSTNSISDANTILWPSEQQLDKNCLFTDGNKVYAVIDGEFQRIDITPTSAELPDVTESQQDNSAIITIQNIEEDWSKTQSKKNNVSFEVIKPPVGKGPFNCEICDKVFEKYSNYLRHKKVHMNEKPYGCKHCNESFNHESNLKIHSSIHNETTRPTCVQCGKSFSRVASLKAHLSYHLQDETLMCAECGDEFTTLYSLDKHMNEHTVVQNREKKTFSCKYPQCNEVFDKSTTLRVHTKKHQLVSASLAKKQIHKKVLDRTGFSHTCSYCNKRFQKPSQLERHIRIHTGERPYKCTICNKAFNQSGALKLHMPKHTKEKPHKCDLCTMTFSQRGNLRAHVARVHSINPGEENKRYKCDYCPCMFRKLGSMNSHVSRFHPKGAMVNDRFTGSKNDSESNIEIFNKPTSYYSSNTSTERDILSRAMENSGVEEEEILLQQVHEELPNEQALNSFGTTTRQHQLKVCIRSGVKWHQCDHCSKEFRKPSDLVRHIRIHTHERPYACNQCNKRFAIKSTLKNHEKTHLGLKEYCCAVCSKQFSSLASLKVHQRLHTGSKPFACPHCDKRFRTAGHKKAHILTHTRKTSSSTATGSIIASNNQAANIKRKSAFGFNKNFGSQQQFVDDLPDIQLSQPLKKLPNGTLMEQSPRKAKFLGNEMDPDRPHKCQYCLRGFKKSSHLKQHVRRHTGERPYNCVKCLRSFSSASVLKQHIRIHSGQKTHRCDICNSSFSTKGSLIRHKTTHSDDRPFICPYCRKSFKTIMNCKKHIATHRYELKMQVFEDNCNNGENNHSEVLDLMQSEAEDVHRQQQQQQQQQPQHSIEENDLMDVTFSHTNMQSVQPNATIVYQDNQQRQQHQISNVDLTNDYVTSHDAISHHLLLNNLEASNGEIQLAQVLTSTGIEEGNYLVGNENDKDLDFAPFKCIFCNLIFNNTSDIKTHIESIHSDNRPFDCCECDKAFFNSLDLQNHITEKHNYQTFYTCPICDDIFLKGENFSRHVDLHVVLSNDVESEQLIYYKCALCSVLTSDKTEFDRHVKESHPQTDPDMAPPILGSQLNIVEYSTNANTNQLEGVGRGRSNNNLIKLSDEQAERLSKTEPNEKMSLSEKLLIESARERSKLKSKEIIEKPVNEVTSYNIDNNVTVSLQNKNSVENNNSNIIIQSSQQSSGLSVQIENLNENNNNNNNNNNNSNNVNNSNKKINEKEYKRRRQNKTQITGHNRCEYCEKVFKKPSDLNRHVRTHTGEKPFACTTCNRKFTVKSTLDTHLKIHQIKCVKEYLCHMCNTSFATKGSLKVHMRLHTGSRPFKCPHCVATFRTSGHRKSHLQNHFKGEAKNRKRNTTKTNFSNDNISIRSVTMLDDKHMQAENDESVNEMSANANILEMSDALRNGVITLMDSSDHDNNIQISAADLQLFVDQGNSMMFTVDPNTVLVDSAISNSIHHAISSSVTASSMTTTAINRPITTPVIIDTNDMERHGMSVSDLHQDNHGSAPVIFLEHSNSLRIKDEDNVVQPIITQSTTDKIERSHKCDLCKKGFKRAYHLSEHLRDVHQEGEPRKKQTPHKCPNCSKCFQKPSQLQRHIRIHTGERPFVCQICDKSFNQKNALSMHMKKHSGDKQHQCEYCSLSFIQKGNLKTHIRRAHLKNDNDHEEEHDADDKHKKQQQPQHQLQTASVFMSPNQNSNNVVASFASSFLDDETLSGDVPNIIFDQ